MPRVREHLWSTFAELGFYTYREHAPDRIALDTETTGLTWADEPFGISVAWQGPTRVERFWFELEDPDGKLFAQQLLDEHSDHRRLFICHHLKFDQRMLTNYGMWPERTECVDTLPAVALLDPTGEHGLKPAARKYLGETTNQEALLKQARKELKLTRDDGYWPLPREVVVPYALKDAEYTLRLHDLLIPMIAEQGLQEAFDKEMRLIGVMLDMERRGLLTRPEIAKEEIRVCDERIGAAKAQIEQIVGMPVGKGKKKVKVPNGVSEKTGRELWKTIEVPSEFNPASPKQLLDVFAERGLSLTSTESRVLEKVDDPLVTPLLELRSEEKLRGTYLLPLLKEADTKQVLHPSFNPHGTRTGRFSSGASRG